MICELAQNFGEVTVGVPTEGTPDEFVDVVVAALRVAEEANAVGQNVLKNCSLPDGAGVDHFAALGKSIGDIPVRDRVLAPYAVGDVRIAADRIVGGNSATEFFDGEAGHRSEDDAVEPPLGSVLPEQGEELVGMLGVEALGRDPHLHLRMVPVKVRLLLFE